MFASCFLKNVFESHIFTLLQLYDLNTQFQMNIKKLQSKIT